MTADGGTDGAIDGSADRRPKVHNIPPWRGFVDDLAHGLLQEATDPLTLARSHVLVPNRRSARALSDAFVRHGGALLLPRISVLGDLEADDLVGAFAEPLDAEADALPPIDMVPRRLLLARLLAGRFAARDALSLAGQLGSALDLMLSEGVSAADLEAAAPGGELQQHWETNRQVLGVALELLPEILRERGLADPVLRTDMLLRRQAETWQYRPPETPVVLAGVAHAIPAVAALARVVARLPQGCVVLPGFDMEMGAEAAGLILGDEGSEALQTHPMHGMLCLLDAMGVAPAEVAPWPWEAPSGGSAPERSRRIAGAMAPARLAATEAPAEGRSVVSGLQLVEADDASEEAAVIALALRQVAGHPGRTGILVTPDRQLARRVAVQLKRFDIDVDDSAGVPLRVSGPGSLLVALADAAGEEFAPVALLSVLMHPLVHEGEGRIAWLAMARQLDKALRGIRPAAGLSGVAPRIRTTALRTWWDEVAALLRPLEAGFADGHALFRALVGVAEALAGKALWTHEAGRVLADLTERIDGAADDLRALRPERTEYAGFVTLLLDGQTVRPRWQKHPQIRILGPLEARLQHADLVVLGGMNEGVWPARPAPDPFLAPLVRRRLGLPGLARRIGMQAHDLVTALGGPEVLMTRAARVGTAPAVPSRFLLQLQALMDFTPAESGMLPAAETLRQAARALDRGEAGQPWTRPEPAPPAAERPRRLSVTEVALLKADPFSFYARHMLKLEPLEPLDRPLTAADRGTAVHAMLEALFRDADGAETDIDRLVAAGLERLGDGPELQALWKPRLTRMVECAIELQQSAPARVIGVEKRGVLELHGVELIGKADRVEADDQGLRIIDYKTGAMPELKKVVELWDTQLALLAVMAMEGLFEGVPAGAVAHLAYWKLSGTESAGAIRVIPKKGADAEEVAGHIGAARADFVQLIGRYLLSAGPFAAKENMRFSTRYQDYDQLARVAEWLK